VVREQAAAAMQGSPEDGDKYIIVNEKQALDDAKQEVYDDVENLLHRVPLEHKNPTFQSRLRKPIPGGVIKVPAATSSTSGGGMPQFVIPADLELVALYGYDAFHRRVIRVVIKEDTYITSYDGWREAVEYTLSGVTAAPKKQFVYGSRLDEMLAYRRNTGTAWETYYVQHGGQDTAAKLVNESGSVVEQYEYDPYGKATVYTGTGTLVGDGSQSAYGLMHMWKGIRRDPETGLLYMRHRFYSVVTGQFLSSDPIGVWGDAGNMGNEYAYAGHRPLAVGDPLGLSGEEWHHLLPTQFAGRWGHLGFGSNDKWNGFVLKGKHHRKLHGQWNADWAKWLEGHPNATPEQVEEQLKDMMKSKKYRKILARGRPATQCYKEWGDPTKRQVPDGVGRAGRLRFPKVAKAIGVIADGIRAVGKLKGSGKKAGGLVLSGIMVTANTAMGQSPVDAVIEEAQDGLVGKIPVVGQVAAVGDFCGFLWYGAWWAFSSSEAEYEDLEEDKEDAEWDEELDGESLEERQRRIVEKMIINGESLEDRQRRIVESMIIR
jgi:RHS repeat-associated protein